MSDTPDFCLQCGQSYSAAPCGPTHTVIAMKRDQAAPSVDAVLREVERRLQAIAIPGPDNNDEDEVYYLSTEDAARRLVAAARCEACVGSGKHMGHSKTRKRCGVCNGTGVDPTRLDAALRKGERG